MDGRPAPAVTVVDEDDDLAAVVSDAGVAAGVPVLVVIGGADGMPPQTAHDVEDLFARVVLPVVRRHNGVVVDGGTDAGVMGAVGRAAARADETTVLIGVAARGTVTLPGHPPAADTAGVEPHHTHLFLVPGDEWGDESAWITRVADAVAGSSPSLTVLAGGGRISRDDAVRSVDAGRPLLVLAGSGHIADEIATANAETPLVGSTLVRVIDLTDPDSIRRTIDDALREETQ